MTTLDMTTQVTITLMITARARLLILVMTRRMMTKMMARRWMPLVLRTRISNWS